MVPGLIPIPDLTFSEQKALDDLVAQWRSKRARNSLRAGFYDMKNSERHLMGQNVPSVIRQRSFVLGWSAIAVDKLNRRVNLDGFYDANGVDLDSLGLSQIIRDNRLLNEISQAGISSLIHAVSWLVSTQGDPDEAEPQALITARDATTGTGIWNGRKRAVGSFLSINETDDEGEPTSMVLMLPNLNVFLDKSQTRWEVRRKAHIYGVPVDPLRYKPRIGRPFGASRISRSVMSIHVQALATMIRADVNGEAYSLPRYVLLGATEQAFQNADGSPKSTWQAAWDAVWAIGDDIEAAKDSPNLARADVKQFTGQSPEPQNAHLRMLAQLFSGETGIPVGELGIFSESNPTSAESLLVSRDDLIAEAGRTAEDWAPDLSSAVTRALRMFNNDDVDPNLDVRPQFRNPLHASRSQAADAGSKIIDKMPWLAETEVGLELMGLTPDQARRAAAERTRVRGRATLERLGGTGGNGA